jgi:NAD(P)-dependent dehydrogenase (short-subunit alcohol dehydrogenase family)
MELQGQVAIVTGAGRGIGRATALELARMGADIVVAELDRSNAEDTASELRGLGRRALVVQTDVTSRDDLRAMVEQTRAEFGRIDALVNNAGIYRAATTLDVTEDHWDAVMNVNAKAVFFATQAALPTMIAQKRGVVVSLASMAGKIGSRANLRMCVRPLRQCVIASAPDEGSPGLNAKATASGSFCLLKKPCRADTLIDCLQRALGV